MNALRRRKNYNYNDKIKNIMTLRNNPRKFNTEQNREFLKIFYKRS